MSKKKITILAIDEEISLYFKEELNKIFGNLFEVDYRNLDMTPIPSIYETDLILYTDPEMINKLIPVIKCDAPKLMMKRTITRKALNKIKGLPAGKKALVANINQYMANETMALIYQLGVTDIELHPYYEDLKDYPDDFDYIIAPEEYDFLPKDKAEHIIIGNRVFDISNILDVLSILGIKQQKSEKIIKKYLLKVPTFWHGVEYNWENRKVLSIRWKILLDQLSSGVIISNDQERIELVNKRAERIFGLAEERLSNKSLEYLAEKEAELKFILSNNEVEGELVKYKGEELVATMKSVSFNNQFYGKIIIFEPYTEMVKVQQKVHQEIVGKGHYSKNNFSDLIGKDSSFLQSKKIAKKIAGSDSTVLLSGASGTGKEIFAGAIHNHSPRKKESFVAINCTTLPENLLESELFGHEEGAFTGAKEGGKIGLFETAHKGTLFLDEIGDLSLKLQSRLLRALEEKEIMRVGGDSIISVDVRVIAATNKDLLNLIDKGQFRKDLFFRLNVFQVTIPPLQDRGNDIFLLIDHFLDRWGIEKNICYDFKIFCTNYSWPGNIRELKNVLEYVTTVSETDLSFSSLPDYLKQKEYYVDQNYLGENLLLKLLYYCCKTDRPTGRRTLTQLFNKLYYKVSEAEVRDLIKKLAEENKLKIRQGRAGNSITQKGEEFLIDEEFIFTEKDFLDSWRLEGCFS